MVFTKYSVIIAKDHISLPPMQTHIGQGNKAAQRVRGAKERDLQCQARIRAGVTVRVLATSDLHVDQGDQMLGNKCCMWNKRFACATCLRSL